MNLVIDIGNTSIKCGVFNTNEELLFKSVSEKSDNDRLPEISGRFMVSDILVSSVRETGIKGLEDIFPEAKIIYANNRMPLPLKLNYKTPDTLGFDRIAVAAGAKVISPKTELLVIDAGTAITYERISESGVYLGGNISPGLNIKYKALNRFTGKLPFLEPKEDYSKLGFDTESAIHNGVLYGKLNWK